MKFFFADWGFRKNLLNKHFRRYCGTLNRASLNFIGAKIAVNCLKYKVIQQLTQYFFVVLGTQIKNYYYYFNFKYFFKKIIKRHLHCCCYYSKKACKYHFFLLESTGRKEGIWLHYEQKQKHILQHLLRWVLERIGSGVQQDFAKIRKKSGNIPPPQGSKPDTARRKAFCFEERYCFAFSETFWTQSPEFCALNPINLSCFCYCCGDDGCWNSAELFPAPGCYCCYYCYC